MPAHFSESDVVKSIIDELPEPTKSVWQGEIGHAVTQARTRAYDQLHASVTGGTLRKLTKAYKRGGIDGAAAWMREFQANANLEDDIMKRIQEMGGS